SFDNLNNAISRAIVQIIDSIGRDNITNAITGIGAGFTNAANAVSFCIGILRPVAPVLGVVGAGLAAATLTMGGLALATSVATRAVGIFGAALTFLSRHPIIAVLSVLAATIAAVGTALGAFGGEVEDIDTSAMSAEEAMKGWQPSISSAND